MNFLVDIRLFLGLFALCFAFFCGCRSSQLELCFENEDVRIYGRRNSVPTAKDPKRDIKSYTIQIGEKFISNVRGLGNMYLKTSVGDFYVFEYPLESKSSYSNFYIHRYNPNTKSHMKFGPFNISYIFDPENDDIIVNETFFTVKLKQQFQYHNYKQIKFNLKESRVEKL